MKEIIKKETVIKVLFNLTLIFIATLTWVHLLEARNFKLGFFAPEHHVITNLSSSIGALILALQDIQNQSNFLDEHTFSVVWKNCRCSSKIAAGMAVDLHMEKMIDVIIGPPCSVAMVIVAQLASYWDFPVFSWLSAEHDLADKKTYSTLIRTFPPLDKLGCLFVSIFGAFHWTTCVIIVDEERSLWVNAMLAIEKEFQQAGYKVAKIIRMPETPTNEEIKDNFRLTRTEARIIILCVPLKQLRKYMLVAHDLGMTKGQYVFFSIQLGQGDIRSDNYTYATDDRNEAARQAFEAVFHVAPEGESGHVVDTFYERVAALIEDGKWNKSHLFATEGDAFSPYLYDLVILYAQALNMTLQNNQNPRNGTIMFNNAIAVGNITGITGHVQLDNNGDRKAEYCIFDMQENGEFETIAVVSSSFCSNSSENQAFRFIGKPPRWPDGTVGVSKTPKDIPPCGRYNCESENEVNFVTVIVPVVICLIFVSLISTIFILYRRHFNYEKKVANMFWMVTYDDLEFVKPYVRAHSGSQTSIHTVHSTSSHSSKARSDAGKHYYTWTAVYKRTFVTVKPIKKDHVEITRKLMLELNEVRDLTHNNLNPFVGACVIAPNICTLWYYCSKGSLQDVLGNHNVKFDNLFRLSVTVDIAKGMEFLHNSKIGSHGKLKSSNCVIDSRWVCKITDFGISTLEAGAEEDQDESEYIKYSKLFWTAPEVLRSSNYLPRGTQKGDVYSFGIILKEVICRNKPYAGELEAFISPKEIIEKISNPENGEMFRPFLQTPSASTEFVNLAKLCWQENPILRPSFSTILKMINRINRGRKTNLLDNMIQMMEKYSTDLEELVAERTQQLIEEKKKTDSLLYRMLPKTVAEMLKQGKRIEAELFQKVTIYFSDIVGFTTIAAESSPMQVVDMLNGLYTCFDAIISQYDVYKVETIGDAYMVSSGLPKRNGNRHASEIATVALELISGVMNFKIPHRPNERVQIRIGLHTGPVVAGVVGLTMPRFCLFGDTVNTASRMESNGEALMIHISSETYEALEEIGGFQMIPRGEIMIKGKGMMYTYWLTGKDGYTKPLPNFALTIASL